MSENISDCKEIVMMKYLISCGINPNSYDINGNTPIMSIINSNKCKKKMIQLISLLINHSNINAINYYNQTVFTLCAKRYLKDESYFDIFILLMKSKMSLINLNHVDNHGDTPFNLVCATNYKSTPVLIKFMLKYCQVNVNLPDKYEVTPLMNQCYFGNKYVCKLLIRHGANVNDYDNRGSNALMRATISGNTELINYLIKKGASINSTDDSGHNCLIYAMDIDY